MKNLNIVFEDEEFKKLQKLKDKSEKSWEEFILELAREKYYENKKM